MEHNIVGKDGQAANGSSEAGQLAECGNCGGVWKLDELRGFENFLARVEPGGEVPAGDCPECRAFAYLIK